MIRPSGWLFSYGQIPGPNKLLFKGLTINRGLIDEAYFEQVPFNISIVFLLFNGLSTSSVSRGGLHSENNERTPCLLSA